VAEIARATLLVALTAAPSFAQVRQKTTCDMAGIGAARLDAEGAAIVDVGPGPAGRGVTPPPYCLVKVRVPQAINIWVGLPMDGKWNGRLQSVGGGGYAGTVTAPAAAVAAGFVGVMTDTGHEGGDGRFGMLEPGKPNVALQTDFAYRSEHLMAVVGKQLARAFYEQQPSFSYWNGCCS
jgi:hypothetical protein